MNVPMAARKETWLTGAPPRVPYLEETTVVRVRFHEVDTMRIVWHGHYVAYLEDARRAFGRRYDLDYPVFFEQETAAPVVRLALNYLAPARWCDLLEITARLLRSEAPKLEFEYTIRRQGEDAPLATGQSVQVFTSPSGELLISWPEFMLQRYRQWEDQWINPPPT